MSRTEFKPGDPCPECAHTNHQGVWNGRSFEVCRVCNDRGRLDETALGILRSDTVELLVKRLAELIKGGVDLRYLSGKWSVRVPMGSNMTVVPGSVMTDPIESLRHCIQRWQNRSSEQPFC